MTPLSEARADAVICRSAARALRRGDRPGSVAAMLCTYAGLRLSREPLAGPTPVRVNYWQPRVRPGLVHPPRRPWWRRPR